MSALFENDKITLPYGRGSELRDDEEDPRVVVDEFVKEHHGLGKETHDDSVMSHWVGDVWIRRWVRVQEAQKKRGVRVS
jgi:hypothetical protein